MKIYRGNFVCTPEPDRLEILKDHYIAVDDDGVILSVTDRETGDWKAEEKKIPVEDFGDALVFPGFVDLHLHSSQLPICGLGNDGAEDWFSGYCYPAEQKYSDLQYAHQLNSILLKQIRRHGITRAYIMGTINQEAARDLFDQYAASGLSARIGKMNSDRGAFGEPLEATEISKKETLEFLKYTENKSSLVKPALCPEFAPACTGEMMEFLGRLSKEKGLPVHSHMAEGDFDVELVAQAFPQEKTYGKVYDRFGLFGNGVSVMAHCLNNSQEEIRLMAEKQVIAVHCPMAALDSGSSFLFPARDYLDAGVPIGLGSDIGGGHTLNMMQNMVAALWVSKQVSARSLDDSQEEECRKQPLTIAEVLYMATKGGGRAFGKVGSFEAGYEFDALVIDDSEQAALAEYSIKERVQRFLYCGEVSQIRRCFCSGREV